MFISLEAVPHSSVLVKSTCSLVLFVVIRRERAEQHSYHRLNMFSRQGTMVALLRPEPSTFYRYSGTPV